MTEQIIRETTQLRAELQGASVDTRFDLPYIVKEQAKEIQRQIKEHTGVPVDYSQLLIMAIRRGLTVIDNELTAKYSPEVMDSLIQEAEDGNNNAIDYITQNNK